MYVSADELESMDASELEALAGKLGLSTSSRSEEQLRARILWEASE